MYSFTMSLKFLLPLLNSPRIFPCATLHFTKCVALTFLTCFSSTLILITFLHLATASSRILTFSDVCRKFFSFSFCVVRLLTSGDFKSIFAFYPDVRQYVVYLSPSFELNCLRLCFRLPSGVCLPQSRPSSGHTSGLPFTVPSSPTFRCCPQLFACCSSVASAVFLTSLATTVQRARGLGCLGVVG